MWVAVWVIEVAMTYNMRCFHTQVSQHAIVIAIFHSGSRRNSSYKKIYVLCDHANPAALPKNWFVNQSTALSPGITIPLTRGANPGGCGCSARVVKYYYILSCTVSMFESCDF